MLLITQEEREKIEERNEEKKCFDLNIELIIILFLAGRESDPLIVIQFQFIIDIYDKSGQLFNDQKRNLTFLFNF